MERGLLPLRCMHTVRFALATTLVIGLILFGLPASPTPAAPQTTSFVDAAKSPKPKRTRRPRKPRRTKRPRRTPVPTPTPGPANVLLEPAGSAPLPGRGLALAWAPDGTTIAAGGHFREKATGQRYDTRLVDVASRALLRKSFDCHYWWVVAVTWDDNPFLGEIIVDGGGDHAVKVWDAQGPGSVKCRPGQLKPEDGGIQSLYNINGWIMDLDVSPDGRWLAGVSRDRSIRIWQLAPGAHQWKVVRLWYQHRAKNMLAVRWSPDGTRLATGDRAGQIAEWSFDPATDLWDDATIDDFARVSWKRHPWWFKTHRDETTRTPLWTDDGHKQVWNVRYSPDGTRVAAVGTTGVLSVLGSGTGGVAHRTSGFAGTPLHGLDWSPDGALLAAGGADRRVHVFDASDGTLLDLLEGHGEKVVSAVAWSPDGRTLASTAGGPRLKYSLNKSVEGPDDTIRFWTFR